MCPAVKLKIFEKNLIFYTYNLMTLKNFKKMKKSDEIIRPVYKRFL